MRTLGVMITPSTKESLKAMPAIERDRLLFWMNSEFKNWSPGRQGAALEILVHLVELEYEGGGTLADTEFSREVWNVWAEHQPDESITHVPPGCSCRASQVRPKIEEEL